MSVRNVVHAVGTVEGTIPVQKYSPGTPQPTREEAKAAVRTLIRWAGEDPEREGLRDTPERVARAYETYFEGYKMDPGEFLHRTFEEFSDHNEAVMLRDIRLVSHCEHHMLPIIGKAHIAYLPDGRVVGISKLARVVDAYARRLQVQERMTVQIADAINDLLRPKGVALVIEAEHQCMTMRGVDKQGVSMITSRMLGEFKTNEALRREFLASIQS